MTKRTTRKSSKTITSKAGGKPQVMFSDKLTAALGEINDVIQDNKETLDSIQEVSLDLVRVAGSLEAVATKYSGMVQSVLDMALPILSGIPLVNKKVMEPVEELLELAASIQETSALAHRVIGAVEEGLMKADVVKLQSQKGDLREMSAALEKIIP